VELSSWKPPCRWWLFLLGRVLSAFSRVAALSAVLNRPPEFGSAKTSPCRIRAVKPKPAGALLD